MNTYELNQLAQQSVDTRLEERRLNREARVEQARQIARKNLQREITKLLKADGNAQAVLDMIDRLTADSNCPATGQAEPTCC